MNEQDLINSINQQLPDNQQRKIKAENTRNVLGNFLAYTKDNFATKEELSEYGSSAIVGVYDGSKLPTDYALFDANKVNRFIVRTEGIVPFTSPAAWGSISVTTDDIENNEVFFIYETNDTWQKYVKRVKGDAGTDGANGTAVISSWVDGNYTAGAGVSHNGIYWKAPDGAAIGEEPGVSNKWRIDVGNSFKVTDVTFDGENMIYPISSGQYDFDHTEDLNSWGTYLGATIVGGVATIPYVSGAERAVVYKSGAFEAGRKVELTVNVTENAGRCRLIIEEDIWLDVDLALGENKVQFDHTGRTDTTVIIRQEDPGETKVNIVSVGYESSITKIPLNITTAENNNYFLSKNDWPIAIAFGTASLVKGETLEITQPSPTTIRSSGVRFNKYTLNENAETSLIFKENVPSEVYFGFDSINLAGYKHYVLSGFNSGNLSIRTDKQDYNIPVSKPYDLGDHLKISLRRDGLKYRFSVFNLDKGWSASEDIQCDPLGEPFVAHNTSNISISMLSGSISVFDSTQLCFSKGMIDKAFVGDSILLGQAATTEADRWVSKINGSKQAFGGGADGIAEAKYLLEELLFLRPKKVLMMIGGNDYLFGRNPAADYYNFRNNLVNAGIEVVHLFPTPRTYASNVIGMILGGTDLRNDVKIDTNTPLQQTPGNTEVLATIYDSGDGLHPNNAGMTKIAEIVNENI